MHALVEQVLYGAGRPVEPAVLYEDDGLRVDRRYAPSADVAGGYVEYTFAEGLGEPLQPLVYEKGFNDPGVSHDRVQALARAYAAHGLGLIMTGPAPGGLLRDPNTGNPDAMLTHAANTLSVITAEGLQDSQLRLAGYSMGAQVVAMLVQESRRRGLSCFVDAPVALLAPIGVSHRESPAKMAARAFFQGGLSMLGGGATLPPYESPYVSTPPCEKPDGPQTYDAVTLGDAAAVGLRLAASRPLPVLRDFIETSSRRIRLRELAANVGNLAIVQYGEDDLLPAAAIDEAVAGLFDAEDAPANVTYLTPYSTRLDRNGDVLGARGSLHLDHCSIPERAADAIAPILLGSKNDKVTEV